MRTMRPLQIVGLVVFLSCGISIALAQGTAADYERANGLKARYEGAASDIAGINRMGMAVSCF